MQYEIFTIIFFVGKKDISLIVKNPLLIFDRPMRFIILGAISINLRKNLPYYSAQCSVDYSIFKLCST